MNVSAERYAAVRRRVIEACRNSDRPTDSVRLLAVSKQQPAVALRTLHELGQVEFGENRLQEALEKQSALADLSLTWHFIGPVQSNKTRAVAERFDWVQSVDREKILRRLAEHRPVESQPLNVCLQVNIDREPQKAGVAPEGVAQLAVLCDEFPQLRLRGLMCLPALTEDHRRTRDSFDRLVNLAGELRLAGHSLDTLSMGMSGDLEIAIESGSTMVRVGTDLFGPRAQQPTQTENAT